MTSTLEKLLYRLYCASAETCRRSSKDDCAQNAEDSIVQFCVRGVSSLRCATKCELRPDLPCFAVQRAQSGRRAVEEEWASCTGVARITATTAPTNAPITSLTPAPTNTNDLAHVGLGVAPVSRVSPARTSATARLVASATRLHTATPRTSACSSWTRRRPPQQRLRRQRVHVRLHGGLRGEDAVRAVAQGAPVPADHGLAAHRDDAGAYARPRTHGRADLCSNARRTRPPCRYCIATATATATRSAMPAGVPVLREPRVHEDPELCEHAGRGDRLRQGEPG